MLIPLLRLYETRHGTLPPSYSRRYAALCNALRGRHHLVAVQGPVDQESMLPGTCACEEVY
jgi:hypothetical protein